MKKLLLTFFFSLLLFTVFAEQNSETIKIACIGNSITYGSGIKNRYQNSYPRILSQMLGKGYDVRNFGFSARTLLKKGNHPYMYDPMFKEALHFLPDIVTIKLGTNDSKPHNWQYKQEFKHNINEIIHAFKELNSKPKIYLCLPVPAFGNNYGINNQIIHEEIIPLIKQAAQKNKLTIINLYDALKPYPQYFPDQIHPNEKGAAIIATEIYHSITGKKAPDYNTNQPFPGVKSEWNGYERYDFTCFGRNAIIVSPHKAEKGNPWIWRPAFFGAFSSADKVLLEKGYHVVYYDLTHSYGSPRAQRLGNEFYKIMCNYYHLSPKVTMEGFSRGGIFALNWSANNPEKVACLYLDAPVCNLTSWPGRKRKSLWNQMLQEWNIADKDADSIFHQHLQKQIHQLSKTNIPILAVCGDCDTIVPYKENMKIVRDGIEKAGGCTEIILKKGCGHHPHSLTNPEPIVDFILRYRKEYSQNQHINYRGQLHNSYTKFTKKGKGTVAFLGGSITEMTGWRNMIQEDLKQRFPHTDFKFIDAGIASTGSTPHAFRMQNDVLGQGIPDLMFVEAAVNDDTNGVTPEEQVRGMEGIIRHALTCNPFMDIVLLHFIYEPFIPLLKKGIQPDVIINHERVANHYQISSINLAQEIAERMTQEEFTWSTFGGTHPNPFGHKLYAATINKLFDTVWHHVSQIKPTKHVIPEKSLDEYSYTKGKFIPITQARKLRGFNYRNNWYPQNSHVQTRKGFVHVPMLEATQAGSSLKLDFCGRAIGIFCVAGPFSATLEYRIDKGPFKILDTRTAWSSNLYIPWLYTLETELSPGAHTLVLKVLKGNGTECLIRNFVINE